MQGAAFIEPPVSRSLRVQHIVWVVCMCAVLLWAAVEVFVAMPTPVAMIVVLALVVFGGVLIWVRSPKQQMQVLAETLPLMVPDVAPGEAEWCIDEEGLTAVLPTSSGDATRGPSRWQWSEVHGLSVSRGYLLFHTDGMWQPFIPKRAFTGSDQMNTVAAYVRGQISASS